MAGTIEARDAEALIAAGGVDVVDVREPHEWEGGHIPGARLVPLAALRADPKGKLPQGKIVFVCSRGSRSATAAKIAEDAGLTDVYSLDGGLAAWMKAGLPMEAPPAPPTSSAPAARLPASPPENDPSACGIPEPALDAAVGKNLRDLRTQRNLSLDDLAKMTGLSRALLGQIELGHGAPSVSVVWTIARAFDVPFSALLVRPERVPTSVLRGAEAKRLVSPDGRFSSRPLFPVGARPTAEFYELFLAAHAREDAKPHAPGTQENLIVTRGRLDLEVAGERYELVKGDAITFSADVPHSYSNPSNEECWMYLVMTYAQQAPG